MMANPYYVDPGPSVGDTLFDLGTKLYGLRQNDRKMDQADQQLGISRRQTAVMEDNARIAQERLTLDQQKQESDDLANRISERKAISAQFTPATMLALESDEGMARMSKAIGADIKKFKSVPVIYNTLRSEMARLTIDGVSPDRMSMYLAAKARNAVYQPLLEKDLEKAIKDAEGDPERQKFLSLYYDEVVKGNAADAWFPLAARWVKEQEAERQAKSEAGLSAWEQKRDALVSLGVDENRATKIVSGALKVTTDPLSGNTSVIDLTGNQGVAPVVSQQGEPSQQTAGVPDKPKISLWDAAGLGTGPFSAAKAVGSVVTGLLGGPIAKKTEQSRQTLLSAQNELIRALSINPRFPVGEINRLREEINISPKILDNTKLMRERMIAVDNYLTVRLSNEQSAAMDTTLPIAERRNALRAAKDISDFLEMLDVPISIKNETDYDALAPGTKYFDPNGKLRQKGE